MAFLSAQNFLGAIGHLMLSTGIEDIIVEANICLQETANKIISGKDYYAKLRTHSMIHTAKFNLHWEAFERWLVNEGKDLGFMPTLARNIQLLLDALSRHDNEKAWAACVDATEQLKEVSSLMTEFNQTRSSPTTKL